MNNQSDKDFILMLNIKNLKGEDILVENGNFPNDNLLNEYKTMFKDRISNVTVETDRNDSRLSVVKITTTNSEGNVDNIKMYPTANITISKTSNIHVFSLFKEQFLQHEQNELVDDKSDMIPKMI